MKPIAVQLYSLRDAMKQDFVSVLKALADTGFVGVQPAGTYGKTPQEFKKIVEDLGMLIATDHGPTAKPDNIQQVVDQAQGFGQKLVWTGFGAEAFADLDAIKRTADSVNETIAGLKPHGLSLFQHNHNWEFERLPDGRLKYDVYVDQCPDLKLEIDIYWACNFGDENPAEWIAKWRARTPLLHVKDGPLVRKEAHLACGQGKVDLKSALAAADPNVLEWAIVELDQCDTDMLTAVKESYRYLVGNKLAEGRKPVSA